MAKFKSTYRSSYILALQFTCLSGLSIDTYLDISDSSNVNALEDNSVELISILVITALLLLEWTSNKRAFRNLARIIAGLERIQPSVTELLGQAINTWQLSSAETEIVQLVFKGLNTNEIAEIRGTCLGTTKAQLSSIYRKVGVTGRAELISQALDLLFEHESISIEPARKISNLVSSKALSATL